VQRYICVHGHFYQPPRENPWLETIELQDSAYPYHDWNERISAECYGPNGASRVLSGDGRIQSIVNNYARISFNFGPTLLAWLEFADPDTYERILAADAESRELFGGHGSAMAQGYNHLIMPLANSRDKRTQVLWGVRDFESRFGRRPEGMWLPETAVDLETLDMMAEQGLTFTVLAPRQAARIRPLDAGDDGWEDVSGGRVDPTRPYLQRLPSGRTISLFFYDGPISQAIAFEGLLKQGEFLAGRLLGAFDDERDRPQLVHIATDGETYGHHHRHGEMALTYALHHIAKTGDAEVTNYGLFLERFPPSMEVEIFEDSSWSCVHGVERWRADCGCNTGGRLEWDQSWRSPLREALDWLRDEVSPAYENAAGEHLRDPWQARDDYVEVILDRSPEVLLPWMAKHGRDALDASARRRALELLELQRHAMLMYTSCGWFFDELSGIETTQVIMYAGRVIQLTRDVLGLDLREGFLERLEAAKSNIPEHRDGRVIYQKFVEPAIIDLPKVAAHYAISSVFEEYGEVTEVYAYEVERTDTHRVEAGEARAAAGRITVRSRITAEECDLIFGLLQFGDHNVSCGVRPFADEGSYSRMTEETWAAFVQADLPAVLRILDRHFDELTYSLRSLFKDEQRKILQLIMQSTLTEAEGAYRQLFEHHHPFLVFLGSLGIPAPRSLKLAAEIVTNLDMRDALAAEPLDSERVTAILEAAERTDLSLENEWLSFAFQQRVEQIADSFVEDPADPHRLEELAVVLGVVQALPFEIDLWRVQNRYHRVLEEIYPDQLEKAESGDAEAGHWAGRFTCLGDLLWIETPGE
jgi:alpha-amylase/alpha-mannosidase (GH57 family)